MEKKGLKRITLYLDESLIESDNRESKFTYYSTKGFMLSLASKLSRKQGYTFIPTHLPSFSSNFGGFPILLEEIIPLIIYISRSPAKRIKGSK